MRCPDCHSFLPPDSRFCQYCGCKLPGLELREEEDDSFPAAPRRGRKKTLLFHLLPVVLLGCGIYLLLKPGVLFQREEEPALPGAPSLYYSSHPEQSEPLPKEKFPEPLLPEETHSPEAEVTEKDSAPAEKEEEPPPAAEPLPEAVPPVAEPSSEEEDAYFITATPESASLALGESITFQVSHNYPEAKVYLSNDVQSGPSPYIQSFYWYDCYATFTITGAMEGQVNIYFFYEDPEGKMVQTPMIPVTIFSPDADAESTDD